MDDIIQPVLVILVGGILSPLLAQLLEKIFVVASGGNSVERPTGTESAAIRKRKWTKFFALGITIQFILFTGFFFISKWSYFDKNYFKTEETELIREGIKKGRDYIIPKMTIRIYSESKDVLALADTVCKGKQVKYCTLVSISYEILALRDFKNQKIFPETYQAVYAVDVVKEPGSEEESDDINPSPQIAVYDVKTSMHKYERKTITTRVDYLYDSLSTTGRHFFGKEIKSKKNDFYYYPNKEDDIIGEVEFQIISRTFKFDNPNSNDAIYEDEKGVRQSIAASLIHGDGECLKFNVLSTKIPRLKNNESFGIKWSWQ